ncbi:TATA box-binding protein-associated factor RNA polymerase I subunit A isoform X2 [Denticeps clupeoides]|uniref:TATA box-binding protein-associated factor RNA polymerase I subunit A n=2 Tax=Denticeps clupeoides TaxID=299321 RepID=A0AAY4EES3_9TELE|nr:TATA box-binding protein-associated factor RNA polymerase I subunit A isoform X2 [Denticeps clupeoides]
MDDIEAEFHCHVVDENNEDYYNKPDPIRCKRYNAQMPKESGFRRSTSTCLELIRNAMLRHRWQEAAELMSSYMQMLEDTSVSKQLMACEIIWRLGTEILQHHPNAKQEDFDMFYQSIKNVRVNNYLKISLDHSFHLMLTGHMEDACRQLSNAQNWRYGNLSSVQLNLKKVIHAYCGYLQYLIWYSKKSKASGAENDSGSDHEMHSYFRQASVTLQEVLEQPGVWDPFVLSYVEMLEFYNDLEKAESVLKNYAYNERFPVNPNAYVYLYEFLKRHDAPQNKQLEILKILQTLVPSHELMLEYCNILLGTGLHDDLRKALTVVMDLLEYTSWKQNVDAWEHLNEIMEHLGNGHCLGEWESRKNLWLSLHFTSYHARKDAILSVKLVDVKIKFLTPLIKNYQEYTTAAYRVKKRKGKNGSQGYKASANTGKKKK